MKAVQCNKCSNWFSPVILEEAKNNYTRKYLSCPACKEEYNICFDNERTLKLKQEISLLYGRMRKTKTENEIKSIRETISSKQKKVMKLSEILEEQYNKNRRN